MHATFHPSHVMIDDSNWQLWFIKSCAKNWLIKGFRSIAHPQRKGKFLAIGHDLSFSNVHLCLTSIKVFAAKFLKSVIHQSFLPPLFYTIEYSMISLELYTKFHKQWTHIHFCLCELWIWQLQRSSKVIQLLNKTGEKEHIFLHINK